MKNPSHHSTSKVDATSRRPVLYFTVLIFVSTSGIFAESSFEVCGVYSSCEEAASQGSTAFDWKDVDAFREENRAVVIPEKPVRARHPRSRKKLAMRGKRFRRGVRHSKEHDSLEVLVAATRLPKAPSTPSLTEIAKTSQTQFDTQLLLGKSDPLLLPRREVVGLFKKTAFDHLKSTVRDARAMQLELKTQPFRRNLTKRAGQGAGLKKVLAPVKTGVGSELALIDSLGRKNLERISQFLEVPKSLSTPSESSPITYVGVEQNKETLGIDVHVRVAVDKTLERFLETRGATLEVIAVPVADPRNPLSEIFVLRYPENTATAPVRQMPPKIQFGANLFLPGSHRPRYRALLAEEITTDNAKQQRHLSFRWDDFVEAHAATDVDSKMAVRLTVFKGASKEYDNPTPIPFARVQAPAFPKWGELVADAHGDVVLPPVPMHSQFQVIVAGPSVASDQMTGFFKDAFRILRERFYPTVADIFVSDKPTVAFLVSHDQAQSLSWLTEFASPGNSVVMGRIFDPARRIPKYGVRLSLEEHDNERKAYIQNTGYFAFFDVASGFRKLWRSDQRAYRMQVRPGFGYYVELGRFGLQSFLGQLEDSVTGVVGTPSRVSIVGTDEVRDLDEDRFQIPGLDFAAGQLSLETIAEGYPVTWHTFHFDPSEPARGRRMILVSNERLDRQLAQKGLPFVQEGTGQLLVRALGNILKGGPVSVELKTWRGKPMPLDHGPFSFEESDPMALNPKKPWAMYMNLPPGKYILNYNRAGLVRTRTVQIGIGRVSVGIN